MFTSLRQIGLRLRRERRGVTAVEFGFVSLPLIAIMIATLQVATTYFSQQALETASEKGARLLMTGQAQNAKMTAAAFKTAVCGALPSYMKCTNLLIDVDVAEDFSAATTTSPTITYDASGNPNNSFRFNTGRPNEIIVVRTMYVWGVQKGFFAFDISNLTNNRRLLMSTSVFRAENYS